MRRAHRVGIVASLAGIGVSSYLLAVRVIGITLLCGPALGPFGGCAKVEASVWSSIGPIPVAAIGVAGALVLFTASLMHARQGGEQALFVWLMAGVAGSVIELGLIGVQAFVIGAWCGWCLIFGTTVFVSTAAAIKVALTATKDPARR
jgi:uncharacterized membrane protein